MSLPAGCVELLAVRFLVGKSVLEYPWYRNSAGTTFVVARVVLFCFWVLLGSVVHNIPGIAIRLVLHHHQQHANVFG